MDPGGSGWNDPPKLAYQCAPKRRNKLNKRVSHLEQTNKTSDINPMLFTPCDVGANMLLPGSSHSCEENISKEKLKAKPTVDFESLDFIDELLKLTERCDKGGEDVRKKLRLLEQSQTEGKLPSIVQSKMKQLTMLLLHEDYDAAWKIHVELMCDHVSHVNNWMVGIKRLINQLRLLQETNQ